MKILAILAAFSLANGKGFSLDLFCSKKHGANSQKKPHGVQITTVSQKQEENCGHVLSTRRE